MRSKITALQVPCSWCNAKAGKGCVGSDGKYRAGLHGARMRDAELAATAVAALDQ